MWLRPTRVITTTMALAAPVILLFMIPLPFSLFNSARDIGAETRGRSGGDRRTRREYISGRAAATPGRRGSLDRPGGGIYVSAELAASAGAVAEARGRPIRKLSGSRSARSQRRARMSKTTHACVAEAIGAFALSFIGAGAICMDAKMGAGGPGLLGIAIAHGLILSIAVSAAMNVSGGHINPAVTGAILVKGPIKGGNAAADII